MNRMRNTLPSDESQKPSTDFRSAPSALENEPVTVASRNGFRASGLSTRTVTSTKSYASTVSASCENETLLAAHVAEVIRLRTHNPTSRNNNGIFMTFLFLADTVVPGDKSNINKQGVQVI